MCSFATLTLTGVSAGNKVYDATTDASLTGTATLAGVFSGVVALYRIAILRPARIIDTAGVIGTGLFNQ